MSKARANLSCPKPENNPDDKLNANSQEAEKRKQSIVPRTNLNFPNDLFENSNLNMIEKTNLERNDDTCFPQFNKKTRFDTTFKDSINNRINKELDMDPICGCNFFGVENLTQYTQDEHLQLICLRKRMSTLFRLESIRNDVEEQISNLQRNYFDRSQKIKEEDKVKEIIFPNYDYEKPNMVSQDNFLTDQRTSRKENSKTKKDIFSIESQNYYSLDKNEYIWVRIFQKYNLRSKSSFKFLILEKTKDLIIKLLLRERISQQDLDCLSPTEKQIIGFFLTKKKMLRSDEVIFSEEYFDFLKYSFSTKKNEENLKFAVIQTMKHLCQQYRSREKNLLIHKAHSKLSPKILCQLGFYNHYFGDQARKMDLPLTVFFHPQVKAGSGYLFAKKELSMQNRTINHSLIRNLKTSPEFMKDFTEFIVDKFKGYSGELTGIGQVTRQNIILKTNQKVMQWERSITNHGQDEGIRRIKKDLLRNPKCKLPWSMYEIGQAVEFTKDQFGIKMNPLFN